MANIASWQYFLVVACGGGIGAMGRFFIQQIIPSSTFPLATFICNIAGSFILGVLYQMAFEFDILQSTRIFWQVGLLGALTTFSSFSLDVVTLLVNQHYILAFGYVLGSCVLSVLGCFIGIYFIKMLI